LLLARVHGSVVFSLFFIPDEALEEIRDLYIRKWSAIGKSSRDEVVISRDPGFIARDDSFVRMR